MSIEQSLERMTTALEKLVHYAANPVQAISHACGVGGDTVDHLNPTLVGDELPDDVVDDVVDGTGVDVDDAIDAEAVGGEAPNYSTTADGVTIPSSAQGKGEWLPAQQPMQKRYASREKQVAIDDAIKQFGVNIAAGANYVKKHQAILDHINSQVEPAADDGLQVTNTEMPWESFTESFMANVETIGVAAAKEVVMKYTGQDSVVPEMCAGFLSEILHGTATLVKSKMAAAVAQSAEVQDVPAETADDESVTKDDLVNFARELVTKHKISPAAIQDAVKDIAQGVTLVTEDKVGLAMEYLKTLMPAPRA